jgi:hypothetical protein
MHAIRTARRPTMLSPAAILCRCLLLSSFVATLAAAAEPRPSPHRFIPAKGLVAYVEFDGLAAHADAWRATAAHGLLLDTPAGSMITELAKQLVDRLCKEVPGGQVVGADLIALDDHLIQHGFAVAVHVLDENNSICTVVLTGFGAKPVRERLERLVTLASGVRDVTKLSAPVRVRGRDVHQIADPAPKNPHLGDEPFALPAQPAPPAGPSVPWLSWWFEGDDLVLICGPDADAAALAAHAVKRNAAATLAGHRATVFDVIEGKQPNVETHAGYLSALAEGKDLKGFESDGLFFIDPGNEKGFFAVLNGNRESLALQGLATIGDMAGFLLPGASQPAEADQKPVEERLPLGLPSGPGSPPKPVAAARDEADPARILGLDAVKRIVGRWGFQGKALLTDVRVVAPAPRHGIAAWLDQPAFRKDRLPPIPRETSTFAVDSLDLAATYHKTVGVLKALEPGLDGEIGQFERAIHEATGLRLREDLLNHLGPEWSFIRLQSGEHHAGDETDLDPTEYALVAGVRDTEAFGKLLDSVASRINQYVRQAEKGDDKEQDGKSQVDPPILALERLPAPDRGYRLTSPARLVPWLSDEVQPTILVGKSFVALASNPVRARAALAAESQAGNRWTPSGEVAQAFECLPDRLTLLIVGDHRESAWPDALARLPAMVQSLSAMLGGFAGADPSTPAGLLSVFGIPGPGAFRLRIDPARIPKAEQLRPYLFPSVLAATVDERGWRLISREAFPLACFGDSAALKSSAEWTKAKGLDRKVNR